MPLPARPARLPHRLISAFVAGCALVLLVKLGHEAGNFAELPWSRLAGAFGAACILSIGNYVLRFARWHWMLTRLGAHPQWRASLLCYLAGFAFTLLPGKAGEMMRVRYYARLSVSADRVAAGFVAERLLDFAAVCVLCLLGVSAFRGVRGFDVLLDVALVITLAIVLVLPAVMQRWTPSAVVGEPTGFMERARSLMVATWTHGRELMRPASVWLGLAIGILAWGLEGLGLWVLVQASASGSGPNFWETVGAYSAGLIAGALSFVPGGLGGTEAVMMFALTHAGLPTADAFAATFLCRLATLWLAVALGWAALGVLARRGTKDQRG